jgi:transmembrane sensor
VSNIYQFYPELKDGDRHFVEASEWIVKMDRGLTAAETEALSIWVRADSRNETQLLAMAQLWDKMDALARLSEVFPHASEPASPKVQSVAHGFTHRFVGVAAFVVIFVVGIAAVLPNQPGDRSVLEPVIDAAAYETAIGGISTIEVADGSVITLNTDSRAIVDFSTQRRIVQLERGEIHIDVAHDPTRPLSVIAAGRIVQAVGTSFSVRIDDSQRVEVLVADGRVQIGVREPSTADTDQSGRPNELANQSFLITQAERVVLNSGEETVEVLEPEEIEVQLSWRNGNLIFRGESLATAVAEVGRYTPVEFVIVDEDLRRVRVAGLFKAGDVSGFLSSLEANFDIVYERTDDETILLSAAKSRRMEAAN